MQIEFKINLQEKTNKKQNKGRKKNQPLELIVLLGVSTKSVDIRRAAERVTKIKQKNSFK